MKPDMVGLKNPFPSRANCDPGAAKSGNERKLLPGEKKRTMERV